MNVSDDSKDLEQIANKRFMADLIITSGNLLIICLSERVRGYDLNNWIFNDKELKGDSLFKQNGLYFSFFEHEVLKIYAGGNNSIDLLHINSNKIEKNVFKLDELRLENFFVSNITQMEGGILFAVLNTIKLDSKNLLGEDKYSDSLLLLDEANKIIIGVIDLPKDYYVTSFDALPGKKIVLALIKSNIQEDSIEVSLIEIDQMDIETLAETKDFNSIFKEKQCILTNYDKINTISLHYSGNFIAVGSYGVVDIFSIHKNKFLLQITIKVSQKVTSLTRIGKVMFFPIETKNDHINYSLIVLDAFGELFLYDLIENIKIPLNKIKTELVVNNVQWDAQCSQLILILSDKKKISMECIKIGTVFEDISDGSKAIHYFN